MDYKPLNLEAFFKSIKSAKLPEFESPASGDDTEVTTYIPSKFANDSWQEKFRKLNTSDYNHMMQQRIETQRFIEDVRFQQSGIEAFARTRADLQRWASDGLC